MFAWQDIECRVQDRADKTREIALLSGISGAAQTSDLVAIIGGWVGRWVDAESACFLADDVGCTYP